MALQRGDALLIVDPKHKLAKLNPDPDLIMLNPAHVDLGRKRDAPIALSASAEMAVSPYASMTAASIVVAALSPIL